MKYFKTILLALVCIGMHAAVHAEYYRTVKEKTPYFTDQECTSRGGFLTEGNVMYIESKPVDGVLKYGDYEPMYVRVSDLEVVGEKELENLGVAAGESGEMSPSEEPETDDEDYEEKSVASIILWLAGISLFMTYVMVTRRKTMNTRFVRLAMAAVGIIEYLVFIDAPAAFPEGSALTHLVFWIIGLLGVYIFSVQFSFLKWNADRGTSVFSLLLFVMFSMLVALTVNRGLYQFGNHLIGNIAGLVVYLIIGIIIFQKQGVVRTLINLIPFAICGIGMGSLVPHIIFPIFLYISVAILPVAIFYSYITDKGSAGPKNEYEKCSYCAHWGSDCHCYRDGRDNGNRSGGDSCGYFSSK